MVCISRLEGRPWHSLLAVDRVAFFQEKLKEKDDKAVDVATAQEFVEE